ncbi:MAG: hypothetical protein Aurels2KO_28380 [Aureliella sp.]
MQIEEVGSQIEQLIQNLHRCGLQRIPRIPVDDLGSELTDSIQALASSASEASSSVPEQQTSPQKPPTPAPLQKPAAATPPAASKPKVAPPPADAPPAWELPVLPPDERTNRLATLDAQAKQCRQCTDIVDFRQQTVFGSGPVAPRICFVGEAPGADEDRQGVPFVGRAGQLLTKIIAAMKLDRKDVYILNALKCRPPQNRTPVPEEISACRHFIQSQLEILQPEFIVCLGAVAARSLLDHSASIGSMRGKFLSYRGAKVVVTYHPSYLLRNENAKRLVWEDMQMLMAEL